MYRLGVLGVVGVVVIVLLLCLLPMSLLMEVFTGVLIASAAFGLSDGYFQPHQLSMGHDGDRL